MLSSRMKLIDSSGIRKIFDLASRIEDPVNLSIGEPHFDVPEEVREAAIEAIRSGKNRYTVTQGIEKLSEKVKAQAEELVGRKFESALITSGVSGALVLAFLTLVEDGDEVLCPDPYFVMYKHLTRLFGGTPVFYDTYPDFRIRPEEVEKLITPKTKILIVSSPANPTGIVHTEAELAGLAEIAKKHNLFIISDEIYDCFTYDGPPISMARYSADCLLLGGFSKSHSMTGWRLGYALGPAKIISEMTKLQQFTFVCAPSFSQEAGLKALEVDISHRRDEYRAKRDLIYQGLRDLGYRVEKPGGAFYAFPRVPWGTDEEFVAEAIKNKLLIIPGSVFSEKHTNFRVSYAAEDETIERGLKILGQLIEKK